MSDRFLVLLTAFMLATVVLDVTWSPRLAKQTRSALANGSTTARLRLYRIIVASSWAQATLALSLLMLAELSHDAIGLNSGDHIVDALPYIIAIPAGLVISVISVRRKGVEPRLAGDLELLIPRKRQEQRWFAATALTAGITEEITYRAVPVMLTLGFFPDRNRALGALVAVVAFGVAHAYQGVGGVITAVTLGTAFAYLYVFTGSLWPGMLLHALLDLRLLLLFPVKGSEKPATSPL